MFGQQQNKFGFGGGGGGGFGTNNNTGGFGQQAQQNTGSSFTFGAQNNQPQQQQNTGFGAAGGNTSFSFGQNNQQSTNTFGGQSTGFGQTAQQPQQTNSIFGGGGAAPARPGFGATGTTNTFGFGGGQNASGSGGFGTTNTSNQFGGANTQFGKPATTFGAGTSTFGATNNSAPGGSVFGGGAQPAGNSVFGGGNTGTGMTSSFGGNTGATREVRVAELNKAFAVNSTILGTNPNLVDCAVSEKDLAGAAKKCPMPTIPLNLGLVNDQFYARAYPTWTSEPGNVNTLQAGSTALEYQPSWWKDPVSDERGFKYHERLGANDTNPGLLYHSISAMAPYRDMSFEELRFMDMQNKVPRPTSRPANSEMFGIKPARDSYAIYPMNNPMPLTQQLTLDEQNVIRQGLNLPTLTGNGSAPAGAPGGTGVFGSTSTGFGTNPTNTTGGFGSTGGTTGFGAGANTFGQPQQQPQTGLFGSTSNTGGTGTSVFGQPAQNNTSSTGMFGGAGGFGQNNQQSTGFGASNNTASTGLFGAAKPTTGFGATGTTGFGASNTNTASTGVFGQPAQQTGSTGFGFGANNNNNQQQGQQGQGAGTGFSFGGNTGFGANHNQQQQPAATGTFGFGQQGQQQNNQSTGLFGSTANKPATTFGFGSTGTGSTGFGQTNQQQQPATTSFGFGSNNTNTGTNTGTGLFGSTNTQQQQQPAAGTSLFGSTNNAAQGNANNSFGFGAAKPAAAPAFGFGQQQNQPQQGQQPATGGFSFGANNNNNNAAANTSTTGFGGTSNLFGGANNAAKPATGFGTGTSTFGFGANANNQQGQNQQQPQQQTSLFGGLGGQQNTGTGTTGAPGLFGSTTQQPQQQSTGLFGTKPATGLFGSTNTNTAGTGFGGGFGSNTGGGAGTGGTSLFGGGTSLFGQPQQQQQQQQQQPLQASVDQNAYGQNPLFQSQANGTATAGLDTSLLAGKKPALPPLSSSFRSTPKRGQVDKLRGFSSPVLARSGSGPASPLSGSLKLSGSMNGRSASPGPGERYKGLSDTVISPNAFVPRPSIKRLNVKPRLSGGATPNGAGSAASGQYGDRLESVLGKSAIRSPAPSPAPQRQRLDTREGQGQGQSPEVSRLLQYHERNGGNSPNGDANGESGQDAAKQASSSRDQRSSRRAAREERQDGEYWCRPSLDRLRNMSRDELSEVDFTAGRKGVGQAHWDYPVDFNGIDLDNLLGGILQFNDMEINVYPNEDETPKPPVGQGLNGPTTVSLEGVYSKDKKTGNNITDVNHALYEKFLKRLQGIKDTEFIGYDGGVWKFAVEHFSKYAFVDDDDEEEDAEAQEAAAARRRKQAAMRHQTRTASQKFAGVYQDAFDRDQPDQDRDAPPRSPSADGEDDDDFLDMPPSKGLRDEQRRREEEEGDESFDSQQTESTARGTDADDSASDAEGDEEETYEANSTAPTQNGFVKHDRSRNTKLHQMRGMFSSVHSAPVDPSALKRKAGSALLDFDTASPPGGSATRAPVNGTRGRKEQDFRSAEEDRDALDARAAKRSSFGGKSDSPPLLRQPRKYARVPLRESIVGQGEAREKGAEEKVQGQEGVRADAGLALGRSFRCSWGPGGELVHFGQIGGVKNAFTPGKAATVTIQQIDMLASNDAVEAAKADKLLSLHLERSLVQLSDGIPEALIDGEIRFRDFAARFDSGDRSHEANLFRLGVALFDEIDLRLPADSPEELVQRITEVRRKLALSRWLEDAVAPAVDAELTTTSSRPAKVFTLLTGNQVDRAVQSAIEGSDLRLATLLAQIGGPDAFRDEVQRQLNDWKHYQSTSLISPEYRRIYALLAGITDLSPGDKSRGVEGCADVKVSQGLDWKRALGVRMWYADRFEDDITTIMESYAAALQDQQQVDARPAKPIPEYLEQSKVTPSSTSDKRWKVVKEPSDILYGLIRLYADNSIALEEILHASDASPSPIDVRLLWHLYLLLSKVLCKRDFADRTEMADCVYSAKADALTQGYAAQLERVGAWLDAAFVLLHLETREGRELAIRDLLYRHASMTPQQYAHLTEKLCMPAEWIHQAKAARMGAAGNVYAEYHELAAAKMYDAAHTILVKKLAPEAILRGDLQLMERLCGVVGGRARDWEYGGQLFADYVDLVLHLDETVQFCARSPPGTSEAAKTAASHRLGAYKASIPRLLQLLPGVFSDKTDLQSQAALAFMLKDLNRLAAVFSGAGNFKRPGVSRALMDVDRLHLLQDTARDSFMGNLGSCVEAV